MELTAKEMAFLKKVKADLEFYDKYKDLISEVKRVFIKQGPEAAKQFIQSKTDDILTIATDELFWSLFTEL
jgi:hypothetical protein